MRDLIKPTLLMIARLGLFLAVVAWIVGQRCHGVGTAYTAGAAIDHSGVAIAISWRPHNIWTIRTDAPKVQNFLDRIESDPHVWRLSLHIVAVGIGPSSFGIGMQHWLVVTISALFNVLLMFIYRKRREVNPCEVQFGQRRLWWRDWGCCFR